MADIFFDTEPVKKNRLNCAIISPDLQIFYSQVHKDFTEIML